MNIQEYFTTWWDNRNESPFVFYDIVAFVILILGLSVWIIRRFIVKARIKRQLQLEKLKAEIEAKKLFESQQRAKQVAAKKLKEEEQKTKDLKESKTKTEKLLKQNALEAIKIEDREKTVSQSLKESDSKEIKPDKKEIQPEEKPIAHQIHRVTSNPYLSKEEVEVKIIQSIPDPGKSEPKRIGYTPTDKF